MITCVVIDYICGLYVHLKNHLAEAEYSFQVRVEAFNALSLRMEAFAGGPKTDEYRPSAKRVTIAQICDIAPDFVR